MAKSSLDEAEPKSPPGDGTVSASSPPRPYDDSTLQGKAAPNKPLPPTPTDQVRRKGRGRREKTHLVSEVLVDSCRS